MAITPQHEKGEPTEADLEHAYNKARSIGLFLVEKYARALLKDNEDMGVREFVMAMGAYFMNTKDGQVVNISQTTTLAQFINEWDSTLKLTGEPMRFTATGPIRREW